MWGIGLRGKDEDFRPYFLMSRVGLIQAMPQLTAIAASEVGGPGLPVFNRDGALVGLALNSFGQNFLMFSRRERGVPVVLVDVEESSVFLFAREVLPYLGRIPQNVRGPAAALAGRLRAGAGGPRGRPVSPAREPVGPRRQRGAGGQPGRKSRTQGA